jgi:hypothetical protein
LPQPFKAEPFAVPVNPFVKLQIGGRDVDRNIRISE